MALETETAAGAKDQHQRDHIDEDEVSELQKTRSFYDRVREQAERFASTQIGQFVIERADRALVMIEDTAKWSLPQEKSAAPLERPLPWGPFLLLIILLRLTRIWLSVGALMIGNGPISPSDMVYFIQTRRRKLRAIRAHGQKVIRHRQQEVSYGSGKGLTQKLTQWFSQAMCRPGVQQDNSTRRVFVRHSEQGLTNSPVVKRPREEDSNADPDHNLTIDQMLAKYANENSEDDSDFVPNEEEDGSSSSTSEDSDSETHSSEGMSSDDVEKLVEQAKQKPAGAVVENGVHKAEEKENDKGKLNVKTTSNGNNDKEQAEVAGQQDEQWKSSPGHMSAAMMNTRLYNNAAAAGSPTCFNTSLGTQALLKRASIQSVLAHSTPTSEPKDQPTEVVNTSTAQTPEPEPPKTQKEVHQHQQNQQQPQRQRNHSHQRYRGRNRR